MKILQLSKKFPYPLKDGESLAIAHLARGLDELGCAVTLLAMNTSKHWFDLDQLPAHFNHYQAIHTVDIDNRIKPAAALQNLFSDRSYHIERFDNPEFAEKLAQLLLQEEFDIIQLETLYLAPYIPVIRKYSKAPIALRTHNVEHEIWERIATRSGRLKRWYLDRITPRLKKFEAEQINRCDLLIGITQRDIEQFKQLGLYRPAIVAPIGLDCRDYTPDYSSFRRPLSLGFIGSLDWMPNDEGLRWFLEEVWTPVLAPAFPDLQFHIAGRNTPDWLRTLQLPRVQVHGEVPDAAAFTNQHSVMVVPLLSGSGMRAKILEGMALRKAVLSTTIGLEGVDARHREEVLVADTPEEFVQALRWCQNEGAGLMQLGKNARAFCSTHFDTLEVSSALLQHYRALLARQPLAVEG
ncbi:MAG: glycosyltransferase [Saprospiraceae bacterium]|nr:glycosyltransferase [Saprospiraceae bacterium]